MLLLRFQPVQVRNGSERAIIFGPECDHLGHLKADLGARRKREPFVRVCPMKRFFESRVNRNIPAAPLLIDNRPKFPRPGIFRKRASLISCFGRQAQSDRPLPFFRNADARTDMIAHPFPSFPWLNTGKDVKPGLEPRSEPVSNFERFMPGVARREHAVYLLAFTLKGVVLLVQLNIICLPEQFLSRKLESHNCPERGTGGGSMQTRTMRADRAEALTRQKPAQRSDPGYRCALCG